jgi:hypothetical protein
VTDHIGQTCAVSRMAAMGHRVDSVRDRLVYSAEWNSIHETGRDRYGALSIRGTGGTESETENHALVALVLATLPTRLPVRRNRTRTGSRQKSASRTGGTAGRIDDDLNSRIALVSTPGKPVRNGKQTLSSWSSFRSCLCRRQRRGKDMENERLRGREELRSPCLYMSRT